MQANFELLYRKHRKAYWKNKKQMLSLILNILKQKVPINSRDIIKVMVPIICEQNIYEFDFVIIFNLLKCKKKRFNWEWKKQACSRKKTYLYKIGLVYQGLLFIVKNINTESYFSASIFLLF